MLTTTLALALCVGLLAPPAAAPNFPLDATGTSRDFDKPPPGSAADQALWQKAHDLNNDLVVEQYTGSRLADRCRQQQYIERLRDPAGRGKLSSDAAEALAKRLSDAWMTSLTLMNSGWPVSKTRVCRYELMNFDAVMLTDASPAKEAQLADSRRAVQDCVQKASAVHEQARKANAAFQAAADEADRAIGPLPPAKAAASAGAAPARN
jgi:DNA-binding MarR family transcriptional regulator